MKALAHNKLWIVGVGELADAVALMGGRDAVPNKVQFPDDRGSRSPWCVPSYFFEGSDFLAAGGAGPICTVAT